MLEAFENKYDTQVIHAWGMTEMSPLGSLCKPVPDIEHLDEAAKTKIMIKQGRPPYMVEMKVTGDEGSDLPHDGETFGHLMVRGPAVARQYMRDEGGKILDDEGWFDTSDVATLDQYGYMEITDRSKDVIKSGGEWISSIELENLAVGHPDVAEAAVIGITHPKWNERPLLVIVKAENADPSKQSILDFMTDKVAKWWLPDDVIFVDEIPHTATGKIQKLTLREQFKDFKFQ
jgi:fatty-acyl-CoA synthase